MLVLKLEPTDIGAIRSIAKCHIYHFKRYFRELKLCFDAKALKTGGDRKIRSVVLVITSKSLALQVFERSP